MNTEFGAKYFVFFILCRKHISGPAHYVSRGVESGLVKQRHKQQQPAENVEQAAGNASTRSEGGHTLVKTDHANGKSLLSHSQLWDHLE